MRRRIPLLVAALVASACKDPSPTTGSLTLNISGLPSGANAFVRITGPENYLRTLNATATLDGLVPGEYIVRIDTILFNGTKYGAPVIRDTVQVTRGSTLSSDIAYNISSGSLDLTINGLPAGIPADVKVTGPNYSASIINSGVIPGLVPGKYYIQTDTFTTIQGDRFGTTSIKDSVVVAASTTPATSSVNYTLVSATLALTVNGLPTNVSPQPITVTGPDGYSQKFSASTTIRGLKPGAYSVAAVTANGACPTIYRTPATSQNASLTLGNVSNVSVNYTQGTADPTELNLRIDGVQVIQVTQNPSWSVPMVAGRPALVRVFGVANQCNTAKPSVRLTIGGTTLTKSAPENSVRFVTDESALSSSWNFDVPANLVQEPMSIVAEMDYDAAVAETNESDNRYPSTSSRAVAVRSVPTIGIRFVPLSQSVNGTIFTGDVVGKTEAFMDVTRRLHPVANFDVNVREPYTTSAAQLLPNGDPTTSRWGVVLSEIENLRNTDTSANRFRYHYGVAKVTYTSGIAGIGYVPGKSAMGWDLPQQATNSWVMAHELGHNFSSAHTPCGGPAQPDPNYPSTAFYSGGRIGVWGYDQVAQALKNPELYTDVMGYCNTQWISDYTYLKILTYLSDPLREPSMAVAAAKQPSLLIWGRIENGVPVLEPAFEIDAYPSMPMAGGSSHIVALDATGSEVLSLSFDGQRIADFPGDNETFSFVVPISALKGRSFQTLRLSARGRTSTNVASAVVDDDPGVIASRPGAGRMRLQWNALRFPVLMVRNRATGNVIAFARGGDATIVSSQDDVEINASNRVRSTRRMVRVLR